MTKITIEDQYSKSVIEDVRDDLDIFEMAELLRRALSAQGYHQKNIDEIIIKEE